MSDTKQKESSQNFSPIKLTPPKKRILKAALSIAGETEWYNLSLCDVASAAGLSLNDVMTHFPDTNAIADAWFEQALFTMLAPVPKSYDRMPAPERLEMLLSRWFELLTSQRKVTIDMLRSKFHLPHPHHWGPLVFALSRHVQLWRETAKLRAAGRQRQIEEVGLTVIFLRTLLVWCNDESEGQQLTQNYLRKKLSQADGVMSRIFRPTQ